LKTAKDISALKAVSQNLIHENVSITDGIYGVFSQNNVRKQILALGDNINVLDESDLELLASLLMKHINKGK